VTRRVNLWRFPGTSAIAGAAIFFLYLPITVLVLLSFSAGDSLAQWSGFGLHWYGEVFDSEDMLRTIRNSLVVASVAMLAGTTAATMAALALARGRFRYQRGVETLLGLPLVVPEIVGGIAVLLFFVLVGIRLGIVSIMLAHIVFVIPYAYLPIRARLDGLDPALAEAAADLYANGWQTFRRVVLPLIWPGIAVGALLSFIGSLGDVVISYFVSGPGATTLPVYIFGMVRMGVTPVVNAVSTMLLFASLSLLMFTYAIGRRFRADRPR
jgi:spermidine/putrescine transport system permease protein